MAAAGNNPGKRFDPLTTFCFKLEITGVISGSDAAFFKSVSGLKSESEVVAFQEGGLNTSTRQLVGPVKWPNLILKRGFSGNAALLEWRDKWLDDNPGRKLERRNGKIIQLSSDLKKVCSWDFIAGWPCKWEGPDFDASKSELAIETLEIAHEGLVFNGG
jgi:phage tail-like protein